MKTASLHLATLLVALLLTPSLRADPATELRTLDRLLQDGRISQAEHDRRWSEIVASGIRAPSVPRLSSSPVRPRPPQRPRNEFSLSGCISALDTTDLGEALAGGSAMVGRFLTPNLQLSLGASYGTGEIDDVDLNIVGAAGMADYHLDPDGRFVTYVGGGAGWAHVERDGDNQQDWFWTVHVGMKQYLKGDMALKYEVGYVDYADIDVRGVRFSLGVCVLF